MQILVTPYKYARGMRVIYQWQEYVVTRAFFDFEKGWSYNLTNDRKAYAPDEIFSNIPETELGEPDPPNERGPLYHAMFRQLPPNAGYDEDGGLDVLFLDSAGDYYGYEADFICILADFHRCYHGSASPQAIIPQTKPASNEMIARGMEYLASYGATQAEWANWHESYWNVAIVQKDHSWLRKARQEEAKTYREN